NAVITGSYSPRQKRRQRRGVVGDAVDGVLDAALEGAAAPSPPPARPRGPAAQPDRAAQLGAQHLDLLARPGGAGRVAERLGFRHRLLPVLPPPLGAAARPVAPH